MSIQEFNEIMSKKIVVKVSEEKSPYRPLTKKELTTQPDSKLVDAPSDANGDYELLTPLEIEYQEKGWL